MTCVIEGCGRKVDPKWCLCGEHWRVIPEALRASLSRAYSPTHELGEQGPGFFTQLARVQGWLRETFGAQDRRPRQSWDQLVAWVRERDAARGCRPPAARTGKFAGPDHDEEREPAPAAQMELL